MDEGVSISVRDLDGSIERAYRNLFPGDPHKTSELLRWRGTENPHGKTRFVVASSGSDIVGMIALIPTRMRSGSLSALAYQAVDTVVAPAFRKQGLFVKIASRAQDAAALDAEIIWGFPNSAAAQGWYRRLQWTNFGAVPLLARPLRSSFLLKRIHPKLGAINFPLLQEAEGAAKVYCDSSELREDFGRLWKLVAPGLGTTVDRTGEWMSWRLLEKPGADYRSVGTISENGDLEAFLASKVTDKHSSRIAYVMEAIAAPGHGEKLSRLLKMELSNAAGKGADVALAWCPKSAPFYRAYRTAGFIPVPAPLRPIEINFGARPLRQAAFSMTAPDERWYVSYLDSDTN